MITYSNTEVYPHNDGVPTLADIGIGLGRQIRWCGHTRKVFSVLAHTCVVVELMPEQYAIYGLLHDAPEAIMSDCPTPWKHPGFLELEEKLYERIVRHYELPWPIAPHVQAAVNEADRRALLAEAVTLEHARPEIFFPDGEPDWLEEACDIVEKYRKLACKVFISPEDPEEATLAFLEPEIATRVYTEAFETLVEAFDPEPIAV